MDGKNTYSELTFVIIMERRNLYYMVNIVSRILGHLYVSIEVKFRYCNSLTVYRSIFFMFIGNVFIQCIM